MVNLNTMKAYLKHATQLERYAYIWNNALNDVNKSLNKLDACKKNTQFNIISKEAEYSRIEQTVAGERKEDKKNAGFNLLLIPLGVVFLTLVYGLPFLIGAYDEANKYNISYIEGLKRYIDKDLGAFGTILVIIIAIIYIVIIVGLLIAAIRKYTKRIKNKHWEKQVQIRKNNANKEKENLYNSIAIISKKETQLQDTKKQIIQNLRNVREELNLLYAKGILPVKYRNIVAVATMYEYLSTGRCTEVYGHGGIFDTYENETRMERIISNLVEINEKLDTIATNQQMLYHELSLANSHLQGIRADISKIEAHTEKIEKNSAISAAADQQTAAIAESMSWRAWANGYK